MSNIGERFPLSVQTTEVVLTQTHLDHMQDRSCCACSLICMPRVPGLTSRDYYSRSITERRLSDFQHMRHVILAHIILGSIGFIGGIVASWFGANLDISLSPALRVFMRFGGAILLLVGALTLMFVLPIMVGIASRHLSQANDAYNQELSERDLL